MTAALPIEARNLSFSYAHPAVEALTDLTFDIPAGSFTAVMGPNGSGKTTLLSLILGLLRPDSGELSVFGKNPWQHLFSTQRHIGYVPQRESVNYRLPLTVSEVVLQGVLARMGGGIARSEMGRHLAQVLEMVRLADLADRPFNALSGGQQQRTLIGRALAVDPEILLLDEPFSAVDLANQQEMSKLLRSLATENGVTVLAAVHNVNILVHDLDRILLLNRRAIAFDSPDSVLQPEILRRAYGVDVPVVVCEDGFRHALVEESHGTDR